MELYTSRALSFMLIFVFINSLVFYQLSMPEEQQMSDFLDYSSDTNLEKIDNRNDNSIEEGAKNKIRQEVIEGDFKTQSFFSYKTFTSQLDANGSGYQWTAYDSILGHDAWDINTKRFGVGDITYAPVPSENDAYYFGVDYWASGLKSIMYSPVLDYDTTIEDKVHYIFNMHRDLNDDPYDSYFNSIDITLKIILWHYHSSTNISTEITSVAYLLPKINTPTDTEYWEWLETNSTLTSYTVPAGDRFKLTYEYAYSDVGATQGHCTLNIIQDGQYSDSGISGTNMDWNINDGIHSNSYTIYNVDGILGVQLYMHENNTPDIDLYNAMNNTVYQNAQEMTIDVTDGSISKYRWDSGIWNVFDNSTLITLPTTAGWHDLEIVASDPVYNNTRTAYYQFGYDASIINLELHEPYSNGSTVEAGTYLNFSAYAVDTVTYEWDSSETQIPLLSPYDILAPVFELEHNLTIRTTDFYSSDIYIYYFTFDSDIPSILLDNVVNGSTYAPLKTIDVEISDSSGIKNVKYHWDSHSNSTWNPEFGNIYRTNIPITDGNHYLYVYASDILNQVNSTVFYFYADSNVFLVELQELTNNSYYQGGETVKVTIQKSNGTVSYIWDSGIEEEGSIFSSTLTLEGSEGIPLTAGSHNLTIITYDSSDVQYILYFILIVDLEAPVIDSDISIYNNSRFLTDQIFIFNITDNYVSGSDLTVLYSIDGKANRLLNEPYQYALIYLEDGTHYLNIKVIDIAGNIDEKFLVFVVDTTKPIIIVSIPDLVDFVTIDGNKYVPFNAEVIVTIVDDDPLVTTEYAWGDPPYIDFSYHFYLAYSDENSILHIRAIDSLGNARSIQFNLIIDGTIPSITLLNYENVTTKINYETLLEFEIEDYSDLTIDEVSYSWDKLTGFWFTSPINDLSISVLPVYQHDTTAKFSVYIEDIVGNNFTYTFLFLIDIEAPIVDLAIFNPAKDKWVDASGVYYVKSGIQIVYNASVNDDLVSFEYYWDGYSENIQILNESESWTLETPLIDGFHNLTVILTDDSVGLFPNQVTQTFYFFVDNIVLNFSKSNDFIETLYAYENSTNLIYGNNVSFVLNITDATYGLEILGLQYKIIKDMKLNLSVEIIKLDNITYEILIIATNVTKGLLTEIEIQFYKFEESKQLIRIYLDIEKKEGSLSIDSRSIQEVTYEENITIVMKLENNVGENERIIMIIIDGDTHIFNFTELPDRFYQFNISSVMFQGKGNYSLVIYVESNFFIGESIIDIEINPLETMLTIEVSEHEIIEEAQLIITGQLTLLNGTPISLAEIEITIYIKLKENGKRVYAFDTANYDDLEVFTVTTDFEGYFQKAFSMSADIDYVDIEVSYSGDDYYGIINSALEAPVFTTPPPGLPSWLLYIIIGGSLALALIISIIVYKVTRRKPFQKFLEEITDEEVEENYSIISPGAVLSIFDQKKGPVPLVMDHSLKFEKYSIRLRMGIENFLLKISDQAYSSLGFEEHDVGRRVGSIVLPGEKMIGWVHGIQLPNEAARGGFENLSLIVLADTDFGTYLLNYQEYIYDEADLLNSALKSKKELTEINEILIKIRKKSVQIMLAAQKMEN
ncbi:MAG: hypothetical protein HGN29_02100 [Asgard group archaeon]|nr:hypothetical protein [Asgard group archaeon]